MIAILDRITEPIKPRCPLCDNQIENDDDLYCSSCKIEDEFNQWAEAQKREYEMNKTRKIFEVWVLEQFGKNGKVMLGNFHEEDGYEDQTINAMWIGFNAGLELYPLV